MPDRRTRAISARRRSAPRRGPWPALLVAVVVLGAGGVGALKWAETRPGRATLLGLGARNVRADVQAAVDAALAGVLPGLAPGPAREDRPADSDRPAPAHGAEAVIRCRVVPVADGRTWWEIQAAVARALRPAGARVLWGERLPAAGARRSRPDETRDLLRLDVGVDGQPTHTLVLHRAGRRPDPRWEDEAGAGWRRLRDGEGPLVALVVDGCGDDREEAARRLLDLPVPLTLAVLPGRSYSRHFALQGTGLVLPPDEANRAVDAAAVARRAAACPVEVTVGGGAAFARRREIMLHLPLGEPAGDGADPRAVTAGMDRREITARLDAALAGLPGVRGASLRAAGAAGGSATAPEGLVVELAERGMYLVEGGAVADRSRPRDGGPGPAVARRLDGGGATAGRVSGNLDRLVAEARRDGGAVGICRSSDAAAEALTRAVARHAAEGVRFVTVSELLALRGAEEES